MAMGWSDEATGGWHVPYRSWINDTPPLENRKLLSMLGVLSGCGELLQPLDVPPIAIAMDVLS